MIREHVAIVLNEREPFKKVMASTVQTALAKESIIAERIAVSETLIPELIARAPQVVVLDYILGDLATGFDVLENLQKQTTADTTFFFLTDEYSASVAVSAMKAGARDFIDIHTTNAASLLIGQITPLFRERPLPFQNELLPAKIVARSDAARLLAAQIARVKRLQPPVTLVHGPAGSGVSYGLRFLRRQLSETIWHPLALALDQTAPESLEKIFCAATTSNYGIAIDDFELDDGQILALLQTVKTRHKQRVAPLLIGTHDLETARAVEKMFNPLRVYFPPLQERQADMGELLEIFLAEAPLLDNAAYSITGADLHWLESIDWQKNITQFRTCIMEALLTYPENSEAFRNAITCAVRSYGVLSEPDSYPLNKLHVLRTLERSGFSRRVTAMRLGISLPALQNLLHPSDFANAVQEGEPT